ncbi:MAG: LuxR family transcriptional regulator [Gammaproteobacteria bacterium]|nr:MAG: LuxR family transcriptional regulator [Gammaproteobacteria bacterium]
MESYKLGDYEHRMIAAIYDAALNSTKWRAVLADICQHIDADEASLLFFDGQHMQRNFVITAFNLDNDKFVAEHLKDEAEKIKLLFKGSPSGKVFTANEIAANTGISYEDYVGEPTKINERKELQVRVGIPLLLGEIICAAMGFHCFHNSAALSKNAIEFIELLSPHLVRAMQIHNHISVLIAENNSLLESIERANLAVLFLDTNLRITYTSKEAQKTLANHPALKINSHQRLQAFIHQEQLNLETLLTEFLRHGFQANLLATDGISLPLQHPDKTHPLKLCFIPLNKAGVILNNDVPCLAIFLTDPERKRFISPVYLQQAYKLTVTEAQLAQLILQGLTIADISALRRTSLETIRWQIKQIMQKTQTHSQAELTRLLMLLSNDFNNSMPLNDLADTSFQ